MQEQLEQDLRRLITRLEQEQRRLITKFEADVRLAVLRGLSSVFDRAADVDAGRLAYPAAALSSAPVDPLPAPRAPARRTFTAEDLVAIRVRLTTLIRQQPGLSTTQLARIVGIPSGKLRRQLRQLIDERVIEIEEKAGGGFRRHTYRPTTPHVEHRAEPLTLVAGALA